MPTPEEEREADKLGNPPVAQLQNDLLVPLKRGSIATVN